MNAMNFAFTLLCIYYVASPFLSHTFSATVTQIYSVRTRENFMG